MILDTVNPVLQQKISRFTPQAPLSLMSITSLNIIGKQIRIF